VWRPANSIIQTIRPPYLNNYIDPATFKPCGHEFSNQGDAHHRFTDRGNAFTGRVNIQDLP